MRFLKRLQQNFDVEAARVPGKKDRYRKARVEKQKGVRSPVSNQIPEDEEVAVEETPKAIKPAQQKEPAQAPEDNSSDNWEEDNSQEEEIEEGIVQTGISLKDKPDRMGEILSFKPHLFIVNGLSHDLVRFFTRAASEISNPKQSERIFGKSKIKGDEKNPLDLTFAYLVSNQVVSSLTEKAENLKVASFEFTKQLRSSHPFQSLKLPDTIESVLLDNALIFKQEMQSNFEKMRGDTEDNDFGQLASLQMQGNIPMDYMRFLTLKNSAKSFYVGGMPTGSGRDGMIYILCDKQEANLFLKTMKKFNPPLNFADDLFFPSYIDSGFKPTKPQIILPDNCIILESKQPFDVNKKLDGSDEKIAASSKVLGAESLTVIEALSALAIELTGRNSMPGKFVKGTLVAGNRIVHFSRDFKKAIIWCGSKPVALKPEREEEIIKLFDLSNIDTTFTK